jgi:ATP-binding cassette subfamily G (WHITE) protein 1
LLSEGKILYQGEVSHAVDYFATLGFPCPQFSNPADYFFMKILNNQDFQSDEKESNQERLDRLIKTYAASKEYDSVQKIITSPPQDGLHVSSYKKRAPFMQQYAYLFQRASKNAIRNPLIIRAKLGQSVIIGLIIGLVYLNVDSRQGQAAIQDRTGVLFFLVTFSLCDFNIKAVNSVMNSAMGVLSIFGLEKAVFAREYSSGYYGLPAYFFSKSMVEVPSQVIFPFIMGYS